MNNHRAAIKANKNTLLAEHFRDDGGCCISHCIIQPIEQIDDTGTKEDQKKRRLQREAFWIKELRTLTPYGLNDRLDSKNWRYRWKADVAGICFNKLTYNRESHRVRGHKLTIKTFFDNTWFLDALVY